MTGLPKSGIIDIMKEIQALPDRRKIWKIKSFAGPRVKKEANIRCLEAKIKNYEKNNE